MSPWTREIQVTSSPFDIDCKVRKILEVFEHEPVLFPASWGWWVTGKTQGLEGSGDTCPKVSTPVQPVGPLF